MIARISYQESLPHLRFERLLLLAVCFVVSTGGLQASAAESGKATDAFLAKNGQAEAVIVVGAESGPFYRWVAEEVQRYIKRLSYAELPIVTSDKVPTGKTLIVVGGPEVNPLSAAAQQKQLVNFSGLKPEGFVLKAVELKGRQALVAGGNDETGTMYAGYELLERLGIVFQITNDIIPEQKPNLALPALDVRMEPMAKYRGAMKEEAEGNWYMGLQEWCSLIDQMAKLKLNTLQLWIGIGSPWLEFSYKGEVGEIIHTPESGYLAWGYKSRSWGTSAHSTTGTAKDVRVGREVFAREYVGAPEFADVKTEEEAYRVARDFLRALIRYAHKRHVQVSLMPAELSFVPPNMVKVRTPEMMRYHRFCGVAMSPGDPVTLDIWEAAMLALIETYPEADAYGFWTAEHSPEMHDPRVQEILHQYAAMRAKLPSVAEIRRRGNVIVGGSMNAQEGGVQLDADFLQIYLSAQLIQRVKKHHPNVQLVVMTLFRGYMLPVLDAMLPKDVWLGNMEQSASTGPVMDFYSGMTGRELIVGPRINDDGDEMRMQFNAMEFDRDEIITGTAKYGLAGVVGYSGPSRNSGHNYRYLAEGTWNPQIRPKSFYKGYLSRIYGREALEPLLQAFLLLEENEKDMVYWGRSETFVAFMDFSPLQQLRTNVDYRALKPTVSREELVRAINATWGEGPFWKWRQAVAPQHAAAFAGTEGQHYDNRAAQCRHALDLLRQARLKVLPGSRAELEYVIYKTENFIAYLETLRACYDATIALDQAWLGLVDGDWVEFGSRLEQCLAVLRRADRLARATAGQMIAYANVPEEKYVLMRFNRNVIASIEKGQKHVDEVMAFYKEQGR